jgi:hypothetical protein
MISAELASITSIIASLLWKPRKVEKADND